MGIYSTFKTEAEAEQKGIKLDFGDYWVIVARSGGSNTRFAKVFEAKTKSVRRAIELNTISDKKAEEIAHEVYAECIVLDWGGITDENDEPLPYSKENCIKLFRDLPDFFLTIRAEAEKAANFKRSARVEEAKN